MESSPWELDEIFEAFDPETRRAFQVWVKESAKSIKGDAAGRT